MTQICSHDFKKDVFVVFINEEPWKEIHCSIFGKKPKLDFLDTDQLLLKEKFLELELKLSKNFALRRLAQKNYSSYELKKILQERLVSIETIEKVLLELKNIGYINDQDWIESFIRGHIQKKNGPKSIAMKLKVKGVPEDTIKRNIDYLEETSPQSERIKAILETKYRHRDLKDFKEKQKVVGALMRKGFDYDEITLVLEAQI